MCRQTIRSTVRLPSAMFYRPESLHRAPLKRLVWTNDNRRGIRPPNAAVLARTPFSDMSETAIRVRNLSKRYRIGGARTRHTTISEKLMASLRTLRRFGIPDEAFWALSDVSLDVQRGD